MMIICLVACVGTEAFVIEVSRVLAEVFTKNVSFVNVTTKRNAASWQGSADEVSRVGANVIVICFPAGFRLVEDDLATFASRLAIEEKTRTVVVFEDDDDPSLHAATWNAVGIMNGVCLRDLVDHLLEHAL